MWNDKNLERNNLHQLNLDDQKMIFLRDTFVDYFAGILEPRHLSQWSVAIKWIYSDKFILRGVPEKVLWSLDQWRMDKISLELHHDILTPEDLLALQSKGKRCVTALVQNTEISRPVEEGRDVWSFCLHDLLHASHFFRNHDELCAQQFLSKFFLDALQNTKLKTYFDHDSIFKKEFYYIASDMNANPVYIFFSFYAKFLEYFKKLSGFQRESRMNVQYERAWQIFWKDFLSQIIKPSSFEFKVFSSLCTESSVLKVSSELNSVMKRLGDARSDFNCFNIKQI